MNNNEGIMWYRDWPMDISLEMPAPSQGHYGFHSFPVGC